MGLLALAASIALFHHLPVVAGVVDLNDYVDLVTPFAVVGAAALTLAALAPPPRVLALAFVAAVLYVDGHGIHLAANSVDNESPTGLAARDAHFWDERWGHFEWHTGWFLLLAAICLAERGRRTGISRRRAAVVVLLLGGTLFTNAIEGATWPLELAAAAVFAAWALAARRPLLRVCAASFGLAATLIGVWAIWHGGVPQFSQLGWLWTPKPAHHAAAR